MSTSATQPRRETHRAETSRRIHVCAQELALEHGLDGFSMDELAAAADVSRRTLFNYFPGKGAAVLGDAPDFDPELTATFVEGGPTGHLVDDVAALVGSFLTEDGIRREDVVRLRALIAQEPRLVSLLHERFEERARLLSDLVREREGDAFDPARVQVLVHVMAALFDHATTLFLEQPDRKLADVFVETVTRARSTFA